MTSTELKGHDIWRLVRHHVLGPYSLEEMAKGLTKHWKEFMASWRIDGGGLLMPILLKQPDGFLGARLNSGYEMALSEECWAPFMEKWQRLVVTPVHGRPILTHNLGVAIITNIHLFQLAVRYRRAG